MKYFRKTVLVSGIWYIVSTPKERVEKDTTDTVRSASYLDLHWTINGKEKLLTKLYDKRDDFSFCIVNFPFFCDSIPLAPAYEVFISQIIRYLSRLLTIRLLE